VRERVTERYRDRDRKYRQRDRERQSKGPSLRGAVPEPKGKQARCSDSAQ
jgi:hypothetical protein